jgi:hypothetical protein
MQTALYELSKSVYELYSRNNTIAGHDIKDNMKIYSLELS